MAKAARQRGGQLQAGLLPSVTRLGAAQAWKSFRRAIFLAQFVLALFGVCALAAVLLIGRWLIRVGPGEAYMAVWPLLIIQIIAVTLTLHGAPSRSDRKSTRLNSSHLCASRMPSSPLKNKKIH